MAKKTTGKRCPASFADLSWADLDQWAGSRIVSRGRSYQRQGRVRELARTQDDGLIGWVEGSERYATKVVMGADNLPDSTCSCPYGLQCKHAVAVVLEYLAQVEKGRRVRQAEPGDERLLLLSGAGRREAHDSGETHVAAPIRQKMETFLTSQTKAGLVALLLDLAEIRPEIAKELADRREIAAGNTKALAKRLRKEIHELAEKPGWQNRWDSEGYTPDYSGIRSRLDALLKAGQVEQVLSLGAELVATGTHLVEQSDDEGETHEQVASCMPVIAQALERSALAPAAKLAWAVDAVLNDQYEICEAFADYLARRYPKSAWNGLADQLLARLNAWPSAKGDGSIIRRYAREQLSDWAIYALERAGRTEEVIPLCKAEAPKTHSYERLVVYLMDKRAYREAELWIQRGIEATEKELPGIATQLRNRLGEILAIERNQPALAALAAERFVRCPSQAQFADCEKAGRKARAWSKIRLHLLAYLERGVLPWEQNGWPLPSSGLEAPVVPAWESFPMFSVLIDIAIAEEDAKNVLRWYDEMAHRGTGHLTGSEDRIASAIATHAPDRAVALWQGLAERSIAQTNPRAYERAGSCLRKAAAVRKQQGQSAQWARYVQELRQTHARKRRFIEVLDGVLHRPIIAGSDR